MNFGRMVMVMVMMMMMMMMVMVIMKMDTKILNQINMDCYH